MSVPMALAVGIGAPVVTGLLSGLVASKEDVRAYWKLFGVAAVSTIATAVIADYLMPSMPVAAAPMPAPARMSVSNVGVQLGRYAGGIRYPGQMQAIGGAFDGGLVYVD